MELNYIFRALKQHAFISFFFFFSYKVHLLGKILRKLGIGLKTFKIKYSQKS